MKNDVFLSPGEDPEKNKISGILVKRVLKLERRIAGWLNAKTKDLSGKALLWLLILFCTVVSTLCLGLILGRF